MIYTNIEVQVLRIFITNGTKLMALLTKIKQVGTQSGLDSNKKTIDTYVLAECFTINGKSITDIGDPQVLKQDSDAVTFDFEGTGQKYIHVEIIIDFNKWEKYKFPKHIKFNINSGFLGLNYEKINMPTNLTGYTFEVINPKHNDFRFSVVGPNGGFDGSNYKISNCSFIGPFLGFRPDIKIHNHQKYFKLTNRGTLIKDKLDIMDYPVTGLKHLLFNGSNKFDIYLFKIHGFGVGIEFDQIGNTKNKWYDWIKPKYTPGTPAFEKQYASPYPKLVQHSLTSVFYPFTKNFTKLMDKLIRQYIIGEKSGTKIETLDIETWEDRQDNGIQYVR